MAWSWSHSGEAYRAAEFNLRHLDREDLEIVFAEWRACQGRRNTFDSNAFCQRRYLRALMWAKEQSIDLLCDYIWERASYEATCDRGGHNAWICPSGCHTVPFDVPAEQYEECFEGEW